MRKYEKKKWLLGACLVCSLLITGCEREKVVYDQKETAEQGTKKDTASEENANISLKKALGIEETNWKEEVPSGNSSKQINTLITLPDTEEMYTLEVSEKYYSAKEKRELCEYFMEADSIKVDVDSVLTKELARRKIEYCSNYVKDLDQTDGLYKSFVKMHKNEKKRLEALLPKLPLKKQVSKEVRDYTEDQYIGSKNGVEYVLSFDMDKDSNTSKWSLVTLDPGYFTSDRLQAEGLEGDFFDSWDADPGVEDPSQENCCEMTEKEACSKAEQICEEVGIPDMKAASVCRLAFFGQENEYNGYYIAMTRNIQGATVNGDTHYAEESSYLDTTRDRKTYDPERVVIKLNDKGVIGMSCEGGMSAGTLSNSVKLLDFEQIKEILRKEVKNTEEERDRWIWLELTYLRVASEAASDKYSYIPAWRLSTEEHYQACDQDSLKSAIWINAIDGSHIDLEKVGAKNYRTIDESFDPIFFRILEES